MRVFALLALAAAALVAAACGEEDGTPAPTGGAERAAIAGQPPGGAGVVSAEGITVVGTGSAEAAPDVAEWSFGVRSHGESAQAVMRVNAQATRRIIEALKREGVDGDDLRTEAISLYTETDEMGNGVVGYTASNTVHVTVPLERAGRVVDAAVAAGANEVYGPGLRVSETDEQYEDAVAAALEDARSKAELIATHAAVSLGDPVAIVEGGGGGVTPHARAVAEATSESPIEPGKQDVQAVLTITFAIS